MDTEPDTSRTIDDSPEMFGRVVRALNVAYWEWIPGTSEVRVSTSLAEQMACTGDWTNERMYREWIHPDDREPYRQAMTDFLKSDAERAAFTPRFVRRDGRIGWARMDTLAERDPTGRAVRVTGTMSDITREKELEARNGALIARQEASLEVLQAISASPDDPRPVFDLILRRACELCNAQAGDIVEYDGALLHQRALAGFDPEAVARLRAVFPRAPGRDTLPGRVVLSGQIVHLRDVRDDKELIQQGHSPGARAFLGVPLTREGRVIGALGLARSDPGEYDQSAIELVQAFAEQAVIAIENTRLLTEQQEALERQTATAEVLQAINASLGDATPVFDLILRQALRLSGATMGTLQLFEPDGFRVLAILGGPPELGAEWQGLHPFFPGSATHRIARGEHRVHILDNADTDEYRAGNPARVAAVDRFGARTSLCVAMRKDDKALGAIILYRREVRAFTDKEIELIESFAIQATIAIENARLLGELRERTAELAERNDAFAERIDHQAATIDVLKAMSASPGDPQPVFDLIAVRARDICGAYGVTVYEFDGSLLHWRAGTGVSEDPAVREATKAAFPMPPVRERGNGRAILDRAIIHIRDHDTEPGLLRVAIFDTVKSSVTVPMMRGGEPIGTLSMGSRETGGFSEAQIELLKTFAEQAVIAITSAETYRELQERTAALAQRNSEFGERIEQQSATIDVLKVMSRTPDDTQPVFDLITRRAQELCRGTSAGLIEFDGELVHLRSIFSGLDTAVVAGYMAAFPMPLTRGSIPCRAIVDKQIVHVRDMDADLELLPAVRGLGVKSVLAVPLMRDGLAIGAFSINTQAPGGFSDSQVALLQTFAEQAVIAITSVANFRALRKRTAELTRSVAELQALEEVLRAVNSSLDLDTVLATIVNRAVRLSRADEGLIYEFDEAEQVFVPKSAYGMTEDRIARLRERRIKLGETWLGRSAVERAPVYVEDVQMDPSVRDTGDLLQGIHAVLAVPLLREDKVIGGMVIRRRVEGGFAPTTVTLMQTFAGQCVLAIENARLFQELAARGEEARRARVTAEAALSDLRRTQDRLVQTEKLASLGQLTAGIAHEIKNPLNFVNNFADLSVDLLDELHDAVAPDKLNLVPDLRAEIDEITATLKGNLEKIAQHGRRADSIVKNMLLHSRTGPSEHREMDLNATIEEALNLAYHGARAETPEFNIALDRHFDPGAGKIEAFPQEFIRVMLNLMSNGFYAARKRAGQHPPSGFEPILAVTTRDLGDHVEIRVRDNGTGIPDAVREKIFEPFFTTKPAGEGTGLGLSLSHDIIVKQHNGQLTVASEPDAFTEFTITLPRRMAKADKERA